MDWPVVPICEKQRRDVHNYDLLNGGLFRKCNIYKGGGGYDQFNSIYFKRSGYYPNPTQFVVQLKGCPLKCKYCYVTTDGVKGKAVPITTSQLIKFYYETGLDIFHLMGGAPALYLEYWRELAENKNIRIFHSDFILIEKPYKKEWLKDLPGLHAVSIKKEQLPHLSLLWSNLEILIESGIDFYITFTGERILEQEIIERFGKDILEDSFIIPIKQYEALREKQ
jgi:organic radical activating enzyme